MMKKILIACFIVPFLFSCTKKKDPEPPTLVGQWQLAEVLNDPGDGSGVFRDVISGKTLQFFSDGSVKSSTPLCSMNSLLTVTGEGTYDDSFIFPSNCEVADLKLSYKIDDKNLIVYYPCIERCAEKYVILATLLND